MPSPALRPIVDAFLKGLDDVVDHCVEVILAEVETYGRQGKGFQKDLRASVKENVRILSHVLTHGREIGSEELGVIERTGARRAEASIPLNDVLHAYRTVSRVCWAELAERCRTFEGDALEATIELAEAVLRYTDQLSTSVADAYARAQRTIVREQEGARREFLADLLYGTEATAEEVPSRAHSFGYDLSLTYIALVGLGPADEQRKEGIVASAIALVTDQAGAEPIVLQRGHHTIALVPAVGSIDVATMPEKLVGELNGVWRFGLGGPELGLEGVRRAYLEAREALEIGIALGVQEPVHRFDELLLYHFLRTEPALVERLVDQTLGPLLEYDAKRKGELIKTIEAYFRNDASIKLAGEELFAHPHTVSYRLKQIEKLSGWSLREPEDKLRLQLALRAHRLSIARSTAED